MRWRVLFFVSLGLNAVLLMVWLGTERRLHALRDSPPESLQPATVRTNVLVRRQFFTWEELESADYPTYIANLRNISCPEQTIRDIIIADINTIYARRFATELLTPEQQWWRSEPDTNLVRIASEKIRQLEDERRALLTRLLGPSWEAGDFVNLPRPSRPGVVLDGPVLGFLSTDAKVAVEEISLRGQDRVQAYLDAQRDQGRRPDPAELERLWQQTRDELARVLSPPQLEEYLLRYSENARQLRDDLGQLAYFDATPDEFRAIFRATDHLDHQLQLLAGSNDPNSLLARRNLELQRENAIKLALAPERFKQYTQLHDPLYRDALGAALQSGTPDAAQTIYEINVATLIQQGVVRANTNLTAEQRAIELKRIELEQLRSSARAMGQELPDEMAVEPTPQPVTPPVSSHPYILGIGDTAASVAQRYGVSVNDLRAANPDVDFRRLKAGDAIRVPDRLQTRTP